MSDVFIRFRKGIYQHWAFVDRVGVVAGKAAFRWQSVFGVSSHAPQAALYGQ
jgi:hypothetical protein